MTYDFRAVFKDWLKKEEKVMGGTRLSYVLPNGYEISVIKFPGSYGYEDGLWEAAVLDKNGNFVIVPESCFRMDYDEVVGYVDSNFLVAFISRVSLAEYGQFKTRKEIDEEEADA